MIRIYAHLGDTEPVITLDRRYHDSQDAADITAVLQHRWAYAWWTSSDK